MNRYGRLPILVAMLAVSCSGDDGVGRADLPPIPEPELARMEPAVRDQLATRRHEVEELARLEPMGGSELGRAYGELGRLYHAYELVAAAEACYRRAALLAPEQLEWHYYLGFLLQTAGRAGLAAAHLRRYLAEHPADVPTLIRLGRAEIELGESAAARSRFESALAAASDDGGKAAARSGLARIAFGDADFAGAAAHLEAALALQPAADLLHYRLGQAYRELGDLERSRQHLGRRGEAAVSFPDPRVAALDELAAGSGLRLTRGAVALAEGRLPVAVSEYRRAVEADPQSLTARLDLGRALASAGDRPSARRELEAALRLGPDDSVAHEALGAFLAEQGPEREALRLLERAVELDPSFEAAHFRRGLLLARLGRHRQAVEAFDRVLDRNPQQLTARLARGTVWLDLGEPAAARRDLEALVEAKPDHTLAHLRLAEAAQRLEDLRTAEHHYRVAAGLDLEAAEEALARFSLGNLVARRGALGEAIGEYRRALELDSELVPARLNLAAALVESGRPDEGAAQYRAVLAERDPENPVAVAGEAAALVRLGRHREARDRLEAGLARRPASIPAAHALARLLASCPEPTLRDGERALVLALQAVVAEKRLDYAETLAMAFAEVGRFDEAVAWQREVMGRVEAAAGRERLGLLEEHLARYERGEVCCVEGYW